MNDQFRTDTSSVTLPDVQMNLHTPKDPCQGTVVRTQVCTDRKAAGIVRHIELDVAGTALAGAARPGQAFGVLPPGTDNKGRPHHVRLYSYASPTRGEDGAGAVISTTVKRVVEEHWKTHRLFEGVASNYLCDLQVGEKVRLTGPVGKRFLLPVNMLDYNYLFFATGTGIAPFRAMTIELLEAGFANTAYLIMGAPYATDLLYHADFLRYTEEWRNFHYLTAISREQQADGHDPMYVHNRIETNLHELLPILTAPNTLIYICGITGMEVGVFRHLAEHLTGVDLERYLHVDGDALAHIESWNRQMTHREIRPTERVFMEVYM